MADQISNHDAELNTALVEQKRLTREVHHRVKNNLQIVSSLLSLQARESSSADVAHAYGTVQARVGALALVHRWMYEGASPHGVDLHALANDLCASLEQNASVGGQTPTTVHCAVDAIVVAQDTAVPLAFFVTELVSLATLRAAANRLAVDVTAVRAGTGGRLTVTASPFVDDGGLGAGNSAKRIIEGMARQLRAPLEHDTAAGSYSINFPIAVP
ncbi:MAG: sensor histidine kinase [Pseudomonadota bacterium]|nr:sensor histidine kinase [Pseudomonadota bacterium]